MYANCFTVLISKVYLIRVLFFIGDFRFDARGGHVPVVWVGRMEGAWWLPAGGIRASQGTFSIFFNLILSSWLNNLNTEKTDRYYEVIHLF